MTHLARALQKYYIKQKRTILFLGNISLQNLAIAMWEELGQRQIDPSVISRVLQGNRLFTPQQVRAFCTILHLSSEDQAYLLHCIAQDHCLRDGVTYPAFYASSQEIATLLNGLMKNAQHFSFVQEDTLAQETKTLITDFVLNIAHYTQPQ